MWITTLRIVQYIFFSRRILFCTLMIENVWIFDRRVRLRSQWEEQIDTNRQVLQKPRRFECTNIRNVWVKNLSICINLILSLWSETHLSVKNSNIFIQQAATRGRRGAAQASGTTGSLDGASARLQLAPRPLLPLYHFVSAPDQAAHYNRANALAISLQKLSAGFVAIDRDTAARVPPAGFWESDLTDISKRAFDHAAFDRETCVCGGWRSAFKSMQLLAINREPAAGFANPLRKSHVHACPGIKMWTEEGDAIIICGAPRPMAWRGNKCQFDTMATKSIESQLCCGYCTKGTTCHPC